MISKTCFATVGYCRESGGSTRLYFSCSAARRESNDGTHHEHDRDQHK
jgi:hypothetical protein